MYPEISFFKKFSRKFAEIIICQNQNLSKSNFVKIKVCQNQTLSKSNSVKIKLCQNFAKYFPFCRHFANFNFRQNVQFDQNLDQKIQFCQKTVLSKIREQKYYIGQNRCTKFFVLHVFKYWFSRFFKTNKHCLKKMFRTKTEANNGR